MKRINRIFICACILITGVCATVRGAAGPGQSCYTAISIGKDFTANVQAGQTVWYSAWTFDLPLAVYFIPENESDPAPEVEMDFGCTSGIYSDPIICMLFCKGGTLTAPMPHKPKLETTTVDGKFAYYISMGKTYRDLLLKMGIDYNVEVLIKVTYPAAGFMSIAPDNMFSSCMDGARIVHLGDSIPVEKEDSVSYVIVPYVQWQYDSIQYEWTGTEPCYIAIGNNCSFNPIKSNDAIIDGGPNSPMNPIPPGGKWKVTSNLLRDYVTDTINYPNEAGMYFAKFYSAAPGGMKITKVPTIPPKNNAIIMRYDRTYALSAQDTTIYALPKTWTTNLEFNTPTHHIFQMIIANHPDFSEEHTLATYAYDPAENGHRLGIFSDEIKALWKKAIDQYLYVRFVCTESTSITASEWQVPACVSKWKSIVSGEEFQVARGSNGAVYYRLYYPQWKGGDMTFDWAGRNNKCPLFMGNTCSFEINPVDSHVFLNYEIPKKSTWVLEQERVDTLGKYADEDGYIYLRFNPGGAAKMKITSSAPAETDPVYPSVTIAVACDKEGKPYVQVSEAQTVTVKSQSGTVEKTISALPDAKYSIADLPPGNYTLEGKSEKISVNL